MPRSATSYFASTHEISGFLAKLLYAVAYVGGCCRPPLAGSAFACRRSRATLRPGVWKRSTALRFPARRCNYTTSALSPSNSKIKKSIREEIRLRCGRNRGSHGKAGASEMRPYQGGATDLHHALSSPSATPLRSWGYAGEVKRADGTSASADATKKNAPMGR